ncbi:MAG: hypothetical protein D6719_13000 [Candidatus Dadabacteria bacterium]|nr:MAG: hypothetical protein D6719_13000 [Candidatus Dadabacteria bacterium]
MFLNCKRLLKVLFVAVVLFCNSAAADELCFYVNSSGKVKQVNSKKDIPGKYRKSARCVKAPGSSNLAAPQDVELEGTTRHENMASSVGRIHLRWPRKVEKIFGRTPQRAMADAARAVSRALKKGGWPIELQRLDIEWQVVFLDENLPEHQIPSYLVNNCHPGWMTPPANIYIVAQRAAAGCGGGRVSTSEADARLAQVIIHEMGHAVEYQLLKDFNPLNRMRSEGFACWFEQYASDFSSVIKRGRVKKFYMALAREAIKTSPGSFYFRGSAYDYARASLYFHAVVSKKRIRGLMDVYRLINSDRIPFFQAVDKRLNWSRKKLENEARKIALGPF